MRFVSFDFSFPLQGSRIPLSGFNRHQRRSCNMEEWKDRRLEDWKIGSPPCPIQSFDGRFRLEGLRSRDWLPPSPGAVLLEFGDEMEGRRSRRAGCRGEHSFFWALAKLRKAQGLAPTGMPAPTMWDGRPYSSSEVIHRAGDKSPLFQAFERERPRIVNNFAASASPGYE